VLYLFLFAPLFLLTPKVTLVARPAAGRPLAGPFATLDDYCKTAPTRALEEGTRGFACVAPQPRRSDGTERTVSCSAPAFEPLPGGVLTEAKVLELRDRGAESDRRPLCFLGWHTSGGWYVAEDDFRPGQWECKDGTCASRIQDLVVAARPVATTTGRGLVGRLRQRSVTRRLRKSGDGDYTIDCRDTLVLYGIGPSGTLSSISEEVGMIDECADIIEGGEERPPSRWDSYRIDKMLPDGRLRLTEAGRHRAKPLVTDYTLSFP
jgi:hypothetical protein